jgi:hypothetical protein
MHIAHPLRASAPHQLGLGLLAALSLALVAFEWRYAPDHEAWQMAAPLPPEPEAELPPMPSRRALHEPARREPAQRKAASAAIIADAIAPQPEPDHGDAQPAGAASTGVDSAYAMVGQAPEVIDDIVLPWRKGDERMPCWTGCQNLRGEARDACTEARIQRHLDRYFRIPAGGPATEFTVVTIAIEADGTPSTLICRPRLSATTEQEVQRVVQAMPAFIPGEQNGKPVRVVYQLPLHVKRR